MQLSATVTIAVVLICIISPGNLHTSSFITAAGELLTSLDVCSASNPANSDQPDVALMVDRICNLSLFKSAAFMKMAGFRFIASPFLVRIYRPPEMLS